jgi:hypothetical protein
MKRIVAGLAAGGFAVFAIAMAPPAAAGPEADFLAALAEGGLSVPASQTFRVVSAGHTVCATFASGDTYKEALKEAAGAMGGNTHLADTFIRAAATSFCPKYLSEFP